MSKALRDQTEEATVVSSITQAKSFLGTSKSATVSLQPRRPKVASNAFGNGGTTMGRATNTYSPYLSTDFLELPQNLVETRAYCRHFYNNDPYVGQAIDLHTELPLSKIRLALPKGADPKRNKEILTFFEAMVKRLKLLNVLVDMTREYYVIGEAFPFAEDSEVQVPEYITHERVNHLDTDGTTSVVTQLRENSDALSAQYIQKHYRGWERLILLPPDNVKVDTFNYTDNMNVELIPDEKTKRLVLQAANGDEAALRSISDIPVDIIKYITDGQNLPLNTDPEEGSFVFQFARKKPPGEDHGVSLLQRVMRTLIYRDKLRQTNTSIASRAMTPKRLIWAEDASEIDVENLREQVDLALMDPDYSIITNFEVHWEEISARDRLLDLGSEYEITDRQLFAGLGVTEAMLTGESSYSGERINVEVINTRYLLFREDLQSFIEEYIFKPVAIKKGYFEEDEFGNTVVLYPALSFTRLALRDNRDTFDAMFSLYQKGSLSIGYILELFNLDPQAVEERLRADLMTVNDAMFNEIVRSMYSEVGRGVSENSDLLERIVKYLKLEYKEPPKDGEDRFA